MPCRKLTLTTAGALLMAIASGASAQEPALFLTNGNIVTLDSSDSIANSVLVRNGRVAAVGNDLQAPAGAEVIDLQGHTMIPGLMDSHVHFIRAGLRPGYDMREMESVRSIAELQDALRAKAAAIPAGALITIVGGWSPVQLAENRFPTLPELDEALPDNPVYIHLRAYGPAVTNSKGREMFASGGIEVGDDGMIETREGAIAAYDFLKSRQTFEQRQRNTRLLMAYVNSLGMTSVIDAAGTNRQGAQLLVPAFDYDPVLAVWKKGEMTVRVRPMFMSWDLEVGDGSGPSEVEERVRNSFMGFGDDMFRIAGLGEHTVNDSRSVQFYHSTALAARRGWLLQEHSGTAEENDYHIGAFEAANAMAPIADLHWSLTHVHEIDREILDRLIALGAGVTVQNQRFYSTDRGGPPYRLIVDSGIHVGAGTDSTVGHPMNPWYSIYYMVTGRNVLGDEINADQSITRPEALRLYTVGSAWFSHDENDLGTIEVGKHADFAVLSEDYFSVPDERILELSSVLTLVGGNVVHADTEFYSNQ